MRSSSILGIILSCYPHFIVNEGEWKKERKKTRIRRFDYNTMLLHSIGYQRRVVVVGGTLA